MRLSMWMCSDTVPLEAAYRGVPPAAQDDPVLVPVDAVLQLIKSRPGRSLEDLLTLQSCDEMLVRLAVARLLESRAAVVSKASAKTKVAAPPPPGLLKRFRRSL
jgi:hypothetical protein